MNLLSDILTKLSFSLSIVFIIVGFLICYIAITRLIHSQKKIIGMKKAFGMSTGKIVISYVLYTLLGSAIGFVLGVILGYLVEWIICTKVVMRIYCYTENALYMDTGMIARTFLAVMVIVAAITYFAVVSTARSNAIDLMNDETPSGNHRHFYERFKIWDRLPLLTRMIVNNCVSDHRRVFGTIVSVAGCMALFVGAITFYFNVNQSIDTQFEKYFHFHQLLEIDEDDPEDLKTISEKLADNDVETLTIHFERAYLETKEHDYGNARIFVLPDDPDADRFIELDRYRTDSSTDLYGGISAGMAYKSYYGSDAGETLDLINLNRKKYSVPTDGYFYTYLLELPLVFTEESYEDVFGEAPSENALLVLSGAKTDEEVEDLVSGMDGLNSITNYYESALDDCSTFQIVVTVISAIYIIIAVAMAFLVLLNILYQFVQEKKKELIIMQINGYQEKDARRYIFSDNILLTIIGIFPGALIGSLIGYFAISSFDSPFVALMKTPVISAFLLGLAGTLLLSSVMCLIAMVQIHKFDISDISK